MADDYDSVGGGASGAASGAMSGAMAGAGLAKMGAVAGPVGMIVGGLLGGLFGSKKTKVPKPPTYGQLMNRNLDAQAGIQSKLLALESANRPLYQGLQERTLQSQLYGGDGNQGYINMLNQSNEALQGVQSRAGTGYMNTLGGLTGQARNMLQSDQSRAMHQSLMYQAQTDLGYGSSLNADEQRQAYQSANAGMAMRGLGGRQGVAAGVLSNYGMGQNRQNQRRQFAGGMLSQDSALQSAALQMGSGAMGMYNAGGAFMGQANQMLGQYAPQIFTPESQMGTQAQGMQYQHGTSMARAQMQQQQQLLSTMGQFGSFAASNPDLFKVGTPPIIANANQYPNPIGPTMSGGFDAGGQGPAFSSPYSPAPSIYGGFGG
jgi:hypothetical protein